MRLFITIALWAIYFIVALAVVATVLETHLFNINRDKYDMLPEQMSDPVEAPTEPPEEETEYYVIDEMDV